MPPTDDTFEQPQLDTAAVIPNNERTDALSRALADSNRPNTVVVDEPVKEVAKYHLGYVYNGELIDESHVTIRGALARIAALKRLGIVPSTSTVE